MKVKVGVSARHVHLNYEDLKTLFGDDYKLTKKNDLSQKGEYASTSLVVLEGPNKETLKARIVGPLRDKTQVEISKTDAYKLGINPPVRCSGDLTGAAKITIIGPKSKITKNAAIIAARHLHVSTKEALELGLKDKKFVSVLVKGKKSGILNDVYVRIKDNYVSEVHLDTDDANAFLIENGSIVEIITD